MEISTPYPLVNMIANEALSNGELVYAFTQEDSVPYTTPGRRESGGHAVAFQGEPGQSIPYRHFDAHFGHFVFNDADRFQTWMGDLLDRSTYRTRYAEECYFYRVEQKSGA